jgi:hypothetical protein
VGGEDMLLASYTKQANLIEKDIWLEYFKKTLNEWSQDWKAEKITDVRSWIYTCLQRNLRWTDVITYWIEAIYGTDSGWVLVTSYRIPILWEHVHLKLAHEFYKFRSSQESIKEVI